MSKQNLKKDTSGGIFPEDFLWGVATSSYQIEGAFDTDGKGLSVWDNFTHSPGHILNGDTGDIACDHYHLWQEDIGLLEELGVSAYRFSLSWPRIIPDGKTEINRKGLDFYDQLVDKLLGAGITPFVTLNHWDIPQALQEIGGWVHRYSTEAFCRYADVVSRQLGDRVKNWITHNEPQVVSTQGYLDGSHPPGHSNWSEALAVAHHLLFSHGKSIEIIRGNSPDSKIGITLNLCPAVPASSSTEDQFACRIFDGEFNRWFLDPIAHGKYPEDILRNHFDKNRITEDFLLKIVHPGDMNLIATPINFLGLNYYSRGIIRSKDIPEESNSPRTVYEGEKTEMGWEIHAPGLYDILVRLHKEYHFPSIIITENGASFSTRPDDNGIIDDSRRISYLQDHLHEAHRAISENIPLEGYFTWTLMDNFEWAKGYSQKFGLVWIEPSTLKRLPKNSFWWYKDLIRSKSIKL